MRQARGELVGGSVQLDPGQWNLAEGDLLLPLRVQGLELEQLFILYPTEGLAGSGTLDGLLPLRLGSAGATIDEPSPTVMPRSARICAPVPTSE